MKLQEAIGIIWIELMTIYNLFFTDKYVPTQEKCFKDIGCFSCRPPFFDILYRPSCSLPESDVNIQYLLYTRLMPNESFQLDWTNDSIAASPFDGSSPTKVLIPGFNTTLAVDPQFYKIKDELLKAGPHNVIIINWTDYDNYPYIQAIANGRLVGAYTALLLKLIKETKNIDYESIHIIGHSLGAHVAGWIGERLDKVGRITGLEPAGPYFQHAPDKMRLDKNDANFVDIIHTNGGNNIFEGFGLYQAIGDVDFYVNGGKRQPACGKSTILNLLGTRTCDHTIALKYFKASINRCRFPSVLCDSYRNFKDGQCNCNNSIIDDMGFHAKKIQSKENDTLKFYLYTTASPPYCKEATKCPVSRDLNVKEGLLLHIFTTFSSQILTKIRSVLQFLFTLF